MKTEEMLGLYHREIPAFLGPFLETPELRRLENVGMNCGCEYTAFPRFRGLPTFSRRDHSLGTALIVWHFTGDRVQTLAALFHDIATPPFAHAVDFLRGDYLRQEATEDGTGELLRRSAYIGALLGELGIATEQVEDYHRYPIADNDTPRLSADRLEYTLGNLLAFGFCSRGEVRAMYQALSVAEAEDGAPELAFADEATALAFGYGALRCSRIYVSDVDRYAMQRLAELLGAAVSKGVLTPADFGGTEPEVIARLKGDERTCALWEAFCALHEMVYDCVPPGQGRVIPAKKRYIDPLVAGKRRLSQCSADFRREMEDFLQTPQDSVLYGR